MEPIKLTGCSISNVKFLANNIRLVIDLTEADSNMYVASASTAKQHKIVFNGQLLATEIEGNNNGYEKSLEPAELVMSDLIKKEQSFYVKFKKLCIEYSGKDYYENLKKHLGIHHLKDLESQYSESMVKDILNCQRWHIENEISPFGIVFDVSNLTHKDNAWIIWQKLFDSFNNPKT